MLSGTRVWLDFGDSAPGTARRAGRWLCIRQNWIRSVREATVVYVNGIGWERRWCPPYRIDVTEYLNAG